MFCSGAQHLHAQEILFFMFQTDAVIRIKAGKLAGFYCWHYFDIHLARSRHVRAGRLLFSLGAKPKRFFISELYADSERRDRCSHAEY